LEKRLSIGISEDKDFRYPQPDPDVFTNDGPYGLALQAVDNLIASEIGEKSIQMWWEAAVKMHEKQSATLPAANYTEARKHIANRLKRLLIYESELARAWSLGPPDWISVSREYNRQVIDFRSDLIKIMKRLRAADQRHSYLLRHSLFEAAEPFLSPIEFQTTDVPDPNTEKGYKTYETGGEAVRHSEFQFAARLFIFGLEKFIDEAERLSTYKYFTLFKKDYMQVGCLRFEQPIALRALAKINSAQLGITGTIMSRLRDFTAGRGIQVYSTGQPIPDDGRPCWAIVALFVTACMRDVTGTMAEIDIDGDSIRRAWAKTARKYEIRLTSWPKPARREPQFQDNLA